jgi:elongation factor P
MASISTNQFSNGITLRIGGELFDLVFFEFVKPGKGGAFVRTKLKNLKTGGTKELTFDSKDKVDQVMIDKKEMEYLYREGENFVFMDPTSFDQTPIRPELVAELLPWLKENTTCNFKLCEGEILSITLPDHMIFHVVETTPWVKGSTAQGGNKPAKLDTGTVIQVPVYLNQGEWVRVDTRTGKFADRAKGPEG